MHPQPKRGVNPVGCLARMRSLALLVAVGLLGCGAGPVAESTATPGADLRFVVQTAPANPLVAIRLVFEVGSIDDPPGKEGLAALTAAMVGQGGATSRTYAELLDALYPMAAGISVHVSRELTTLSGTVHRDNLDAYVELMLDQILTPRFDPADFARNRSAAVDFITKTLRSEDDEALGKEALEGALYAGHPYGHPVDGTEASLSAITLDDVRAFHAQHFARTRLTVGLGGGVPADLAEKLRARLAALPAGAARGPLPPAPPLTGRQVLLVDKPGRSTAISIGHPHGLTRKDPDFVPLFLAMSYLGEHRTFNGVLMQNMRGKRGLNYGDYAYAEAFEQDGGSTLPLPNVLRRLQRFEIWVRPVPADKAAFALRQALFETQRVLEQGIPQQGFEETRDYLMAFSRLWTQDADRRIGYAVDAALAGRDLAADLQARLPTLTRDEVNAAMRKHISLDHLVAVLAGPDAAALKDLLVSGVPTPLVYDTEGTPADILAEDALIQVFPLALTADRIRIVPAATMFAR